MIVQILNFYYIQNVLPTVKNACYVSETDFQHYNEEEFRSCSDLSAGREALTFWKKYKVLHKIQANAFICSEKQNYIEQLGTSSTVRTNVNRRNISNAIESVYEVPLDINVTNQQNVGVCI